MKKIMPTCWAIAFVVMMSSAMLAGEAFNVEARLDNGHRLVGVQAFDAVSGERLPYHNSIVELPDGVSLVELRRRGYVFAPAVINAADGSPGEKYIVLAHKGDNAVATRAVLRTLVINASSPLMQDSMSLINTATFGRFAFYSYGQLVVQTDGYRVYGNGSVTAGGQMPETVVYGLPTSWLGPLANYLQAGVFVGGNASATIFASSNPSVGARIDGQLYAGIKVIGTFGVIGASGRAQATVPMWASATAYPGAVTLTGTVLPVTTKATLSATLFNRQLVSYTTPTFQLTSARSISRTVSF